MPKGSNQKLKLLYLIDFLKNNTDEKHPATMTDILEFLATKEIEAERKSIYSDVEILRELGMDVEYSKEEPSGYYIGARDFELAELKLLVDAVISSKFISEKKSNELIGKIEKLTSKYEAKKLQRQVFVANRIKTGNEGILYVIDNIHEAIAENKQITFNYLEWNTEKKLVPRNNGKLYEVEPITLIWDDENYYLVAYDAEASKIKHYRVDKISSISISEFNREHNRKYMDFEPAEYAGRHFGMFSGEENIVTLGFKKDMIGVIIDRFGKNVTLIKRDSENMSARIKVQVSNQFFAWVTGFAGQVKVEGPEEVKDKYLKFIEDVRSSL